MRLLVFNYEFPPVGGGASAASYYAARELVRRGHTVDVLTCRGRSQPAVELRDGITVYRVASVRRGRHEAGLGAALTYLLHARPRLRQLLREHRYDFAHFYFAIPTGLLAFMWRRLTDAPYVVSLRGSDVPDYDPDARMINFLHRVLKPATRRILSNAATVVANSESLRQLALKSFPAQPMITITNGVCTDDFLPAARRSGGNDGLTALCVSRLVARKGIAGILDAMAQAQPPGLRIIIAGSGPEKSALMARADELGIRARVEFAGMVSGSALLGCYQRADFLLHPTRTESFSMTLLEAMACGLPVIASDVGGIPELVEHEVNGLLVRPDDVTGLAQAMDRMTRSAPLRERFSRANRSKVMQQFSWADIVAQYEARCFTPGSRATGAGAR